MRKLIISTLLAGAAAAVPTSANAAYVFNLLTPSCSLTAGCLFDIVDGNINEQADSVLAIETAYNNQHVEPPLPATIDLSFLYKTPGSLEAKTGNFSLPGGGVFDFYAIKSATQFVLYQVASGTTSVEWNTDLLLNKNGKPQDASHIVAYSGAVPVVPEPATWAMMLAGFGAVGYALRRRRSVAVSFA